MYKVDEFLWAGELERVKNIDGLEEIDGGYYQARANIETKKYFKSLDVAPNLYAGSQIYTDGDSLSNTSFTFDTFNDRASPHINEDCGFKRNKKTLMTTSTTRLLNLVF